MYGKNRRAKTFLCWGGKTGGTEGGNKKSIIHPQSFLLP